MKKLALVLAAAFAAVGAARAATVETMSAELEKTGISVTVGTHQQPPKPGVPHPVNVHPTHPTHPVTPSYPVNPGYPGYNPQPGYPTHPSYPPQHPGQPWNPGYPPVYPPQYPPQYPPVYPPQYPPQYPPVYPPQAQMQQFRFESSSFVFASDAKRSMENAAEAISRAGYTVLEKRNNFNSYTLVFIAPSFLKVEKYNSGSFVFASDARRSMDEAAAALQRVRGLVILEKRLTGTSYNIVFLSPSRLEPQKYVSGNYTFASEAQRAAAETAAAFASQGLIILEKNVYGTQFTITYFHPGYYY